LGGTQAAIHRIFDVPHRDFVKEVQRIEFSSKKAADGSLFCFE
jgi:hypothetical protein